MELFALFNEMTDKKKDENKENSFYPELIFDHVTDILYEKRMDDCNKGTFGTLACICGSYGMAGAAMLCGSAAYTCGAGIVKMILPKSIYPIAAANVWESVFVPLEDSEKGTLRFEDFETILEEAEKSTAVVLGCGLKVTEDTQRIVWELLEKCTKPVILDADGINCAVSHIDVLKQRTYPTILTPHPGEMSRLCSCTVSDVQENREEIAVDFAKRYGCIMALKGVDTVVTDGENTIINPTGNGCLAKGGSGDVLSGIIGSLVCQGIDLLEAAAAGVYLHGYAADECIDEFSHSSVSARDVINAIKYIM